MRKSNWVFLCGACLISVVLLVVWYMLRFYKVDSPLDLVLSIIWWAVLAVAIVIVAKLEKKRRYHERAVYIMNDGTLFSPELGNVAHKDASVVDSMANIVCALDYALDMKTLDKEQAVNVTHIVYTDKFEDDGENWEGEVSCFNNGEASSYTYSSKEELERLLLAAR